MKIKRPLINPMPEDFEESLPKKQQIEEENPDTYRDEDQIEFDIESQRDRVMQVYAGTKFLLKKRTELFEISGLWKSAALPFSLVTLISIVLVLLIGGIFGFNSLPPQVPFFYNYAEGTWNQIDKVIIFIAPIILLAFEFLMIYIIIKIFTFDKRLSATMCWIVTLLNVLLLIGIAQIYFLIT